MASSIILDGNVGDTLRSLLTQPTNNPNALMAMNKVNPFLRPNNNGAENFILKSLFQKLERAQSLTNDLMKRMNDGMSSLNDKFQKMIEGNIGQVKEEKKERAEKKAKKKREDLDDDKEDFLKSIAEAIEEKTDRFKKSKIGNMIYGESSIANWLGGGGAIITQIVAAAIPVILTALAGVSLVQFLRGAFDASAISGEKDLTGVGGALKVIKAGLAKTFSTFTFGAISDQEMYKMQDELIDKVKPYLWQAVDFLVDAGVQLFDIIYDALENMIGPKFTEKAKPFKDKLHGYRDIYKTARASGVDIIAEIDKRFFKNKNTNLPFGGDPKNEYSDWEEAVAHYIGEDKFNVLDHIIGRKSPMAIAFGANRVPQLESRVVPQDEAAVSSLSAAAKTQAEKVGDAKPGKRCARAVDETLVAAGILPNRLRQDAWNLGSELAKHPNFEEVKGLSRRDVTKLPAGYAVAYEPRTSVKDAEGSWGHIALTLGEGKEVSDFVGYSSSSLKQKNEQGQPVNFRVFKPIRKFQKDISNQETKILKTTKPDNNLQSTAFDLSNVSSDNVVAGLSPNLDIDTQSYENSKATDLIQKTKPVVKIAYSEDSKQQSAPVIVDNSTTNTISPSMDTSLFDTIQNYLISAMRDKWRQ
jgi:hypothetical protein